MRNHVISPRNNEDGSLLHSLSFIGYLWNYVDMQIFQIKISFISNSCYSVFRKNCIVCTTRHISFGGKKILKMGGLQSYFHFVNFSTKIFQISYWKQVKSKLIVPYKACFFSRKSGQLLCDKKNWKLNIHISEKIKSDYMTEKLYGNSPALIHT